MRCSAQAVEHFISQRGALQGHIKAHDHDEVGDLFLMLHQGVIRIDATAEKRPYTMTARLWRPRWGADGDRRELGPCAPELHDRGDVARQTSRHFVYAAYRASAQDAGQHTKRQ